MAYFEMELLNVRHKAVFNVQLHRDNTEKLRTWKEYNKNLPVASKTPEQLQVKLDLRNKFEANWKEKEAMPNEAKMLAELRAEYRKDRLAFCKRNPEIQNAWDQIRMDAGLPNLALTVTDQRRKMYRFKLFKRQYIEANPAPFRRLTDSAKNLEISAPLEFKETQITSIFSEIGEKYIRSTHVIPDDFDSVLNYHNAWRKDQTEKQDAIKSAAKLKGRTLSNALSAPITSNPLTT